MVTLMGRGQVERKGGGEREGTTRRSLLRTHGTAYRLSCYVLFWASILPPPLLLPSSPLHPSFGSKPVCFGINTSRLQDPVEAGGESRSVTGTGHAPWRVDAARRHPPGKHHTAPSVSPHLCRTDSDYYGRKCLTSNAADKVNVCLSWSSHKRFQP